MAGGAAGGGQADRVDVPTVYQVANNSAGAGGGELPVGWVARGVDWEGAGVALDHDGVGDVAEELGDAVEDGEGRGAEVGFADGEEEVVADEADDEAAELVLGVDEVLELVLLDVVVELIFHELDVFVEDGHEAPGGGGAVGQEAGATGAGARAGRGGAELGAEAGGGALELVEADDGHGVHHDEKGHEEGDHVGVGEEPAHHSRAFAAGLAF